MAIQFPSPAYQGESYLAENGVEYIFDGIKWVGFGSTVNPVSDHLHAGNVDLYLFSNGVVQLPSGGDIVDSNGLTVLGGTGGSGDSLVNGDSSFSISTDGTLTLTHPDEPNFHPLETQLIIQKAAGNYHTISGAYGLSLQATPVPSGYELNTNTNFVDIFHDGVSVNVNGNTWGFGTDGNLTFPNGDLTIGHDPYGDPAIIGAAGKNIGLVSSGVGDGYEVGSSLIWVDSITEPTKMAGVTANNPLYVGAGDVGIVTGDYFYTGNTNVWNFGADGTLTVPGAITMPEETGIYSPGHDLYITAGNTTGCSVPGGSTIISSGLGYSGVAHNGGNVTLRTGDYYNKVWNFDYNGNLTLPAGGDILDSTGASVLGGAGGGDRIVNGLNSLTIDGDGNIVLDGDEGAANRGLVWNWGNLNGGVNAGIRHDEDGITIQSFSDNGPYTYGSPVNIITNPGPSQHLWTFGTDGSLTTPSFWRVGNDTSNTSVGNDGFANINDLWLRAGDSLFITTGINTGNYDNQWMFTNSLLQLPNFGAITSPNYGFSFNKDSGKTGVPELGTDVTFATESLDSDILDGQVYMGSGYGEFRSIYNKVDSTESGLVYAGVEGFNYAQYGDVNFAGMVSQTPNIDSMYALSLNEQGQITIGFTQNGQTQTSNDWSVVVGTLNTDYTVNGLFANTNVTVIGSGLSSWTFDKDGTTTFPTGGRISTTGKGGTSLDGGLDGGWTSLTNYYANGNYAACVTAYSNGRLYITTYNDGGPDPSREWAFDNTGNLTLPANGYILNSDLTVYGGGGGGGNYSNSNVSDYMPVYSGNIGGNIVHNGYSWTFGDDGNLFLPDGGMLTNIFGETTLTNPAGAAISASIGNAIAVSEQYGAAVYVNNNAWQFQANANVILPPGGYILNSSGSIYGQSAAAGIGTQNIELSTDLSFLLDSLTGNIMYITKNQYYSGTDEHAILLSATPADGTRIVFYNETDLIANVHYGDLYYLMDPTGRLEMAYSYYQGSPSWLPIAYTIFSP